MHHVLNVVLTHQSPEAVKHILRWWKEFSPPDDLLIAYGGTQEDFEAIKSPQAVFVSDPRLRTQNHPLEEQSYSGLFADVSTWLHDQPHEFIHLAEFDHLPLVVDLDHRLVTRLESENADVLGFHVQRIDETNSPHLLFEMSDSRFERYWRDLSVREDKSVILNMIPTGALWTRDAFCAVAAHGQGMPAYLEIFLPTLAHHLGFRVRGIPDQQKFVSVAGDRWPEIERAVLAGAWSLHPVKSLERPEPWAALQKIVSAQICPNR